MTLSTAQITQALALMTQAQARMQDPYADDLMVIAEQTMSLLGSLTEEYSPEYFTDEEVELISNTMMVALDVLVDHTHNREDQNEL